MYLYNKKFQLVIKISIVIELKVSVTENFIRLCFCRTFRSIPLMLFLPDSPPPLFVVVVVVVVVQFMLGCLGAYMTLVLSQFC